MSPEKIKQQIEYVSPENSAEDGILRNHEFNLIINGKKVGGAEVHYFSAPLPIYQLSELYVDFEEKGKGYASQLLDRVETFLKERKKPGILTDAIFEGDPASGMYERHGWKKIPSDLNLMVYNWPDDVSPDILIGYPNRQRDMLDRMEDRNN